MENIFFFSGILLFIYFLFWFLLSLFFQRNDVADVAWGGGFVLLAVISLLFNWNNSSLRLITVLILVWGIRLGLHIFSRNRRKKEDPRYEKWRREWGRWFLL